MTRKPCLGKFARAGAGRIHAALTDGLLDGWTAVLQPARYPLHAAQFVGRQASDLHPKYWPCNVE